MVKASSCTKKAVRNESFLKMDLMSNVIRSREISNVLGIFTSDN